MTQSCLALTHFSEFDPTRQAICQNPDFSDPFQGASVDQAVEISDNPVCWRTQSRLVVPPPAMLRGICNVIALTAE